MLTCNNCGHVSPNHDSDVSVSDAMDQLEAGEIDYSEYEDLIAGSRFVCDQCGSLDTEETAD